VIKICKPFKNAKTWHISQPFGVNPQSYQPDGHVGVDWANGRKGTWLVSPVKCRVIKVVGAISLTEGSEIEIRRGYGIVLESLVDVNTFYLHWHCNPVFPVSEGDFVDQGQRVAQMSNSGYVFHAGEYVPISERLGTNKGVHTHFEGYHLVNGKKEYFDTTPLIDWSIEIPDKGILVAISNVIAKIIKLLK